MAWKLETSKKPEQGEVLLLNVIERLAGSMNGGAEVPHGAWHAILRNEFAHCDVSYDVTVGALGRFLVSSGPGTAHVIGELKPGQILYVQVPLAPGETPEDAGKSMVIWEMARSVVDQSSAEQPRASELRESPPDRVEQRPAQARDLTSSGTQAHSWQK